MRLATFWLTSLSSTSRMRAPSSIILGLVEATIVASDVVEVDSEEIEPNDENEGEGEGDDENEQTLENEGEGDEKGDESDVSSEAEKDETEK
jgi:hypothetical protein